MKTPAADILLYLGLAVIVGGVALFDYRVAIIVLGLMLCGLALMKALTHVD